MACRYRDVLILLFLGVEIGELRGWQVELPSELRDERVVDAHASAHIASARCGRDSVLGVIDIELLGPCQLWCLDVLDVACARDVITIGCRLISFKRGGLEVGSDLEFANCSCERGGARLGQRQDVDRGRVGCHLQFFFDRLRERAERCAEVLILHSVHVVVSTGDGEFARLLRVQNALLEHSHHVLLPVVCLHVVQTGLHGHFLDEKSVERGLQCGHEFRNLILGVEFDGAHDCLLLKHPGP